MDPREAVCPECNLVFWREAGVRLVHIVVCRWCGLVRS